MSSEASSEASSDSLVLDVAAKAARDAFTLDVELRAPRGVTILFGASGAGKSTTLALIAGLVRPTAGRIALGSEVWFDARTHVDRPVHLRGIAFVFQSLALFPHMTAEENVAYGMSRALSKNERREQALSMLARLRVAHLQGRRPATFSGGEGQRVALARALAQKPALVLLDEPFSAMDRDLRNKLLADLRAFVDELDVPVLHVTHHRGEARALGDRAILMENGRVVGSGTVAEIVGNEGDDVVHRLERGARGD